MWCLETGAALLPVCCVNLRLLNVHFCCPADWCLILRDYRDAGARLRTLTDARLDDSADQLCPLNTTYCHFPQHWVDPYVEFRQCIEWETTVLLYTAHNLRDSCRFLESRSTCRNTVTGVGGFEKFPSPIGGQTVTNLFPRLLDDESKNDAVQRKHIN